MDLSKENLTKLIDLLNENLLKPIDAKLLLKISALLFTGCSIFYVCKIINAYRVFKKLGLKTPDYKFFFGNLPEILENTQSNTLRKWTKKYGKTYGYYEGHLPVMVTSDCEIIQEVFIKQYSNFMARKEYPFQFADDSPKMDLFLSTNKRWKRMRNIINPTFSPAKLKELMPIMKKCANRFLQVLANNENKELVISDFLNRYTMDTIWNCATGMDIDCQNNPDNLYMRKALLVFKDLEELKFAFRVTSYLSEFRPWILGFVSFFTWAFGKLTHKHEFVDPLFWLTQHIGNIIDARKQQNINKKDFIQLLMETEIDDKEELKRKEKIHLDKFRLDRQMSTEEIKFNLVGFLLAGFETTSTALNYCFYLLAKHPDEMAEVQDELDHYYGSGYAEPDFDNIGDLVYLDMFVHETLRMFPISSNTVNRRCMFPTKLNKMDIPAGLSVTVDVLSLHYDPEYWGPVDPEEFYPLRFSPDNKRHPASYLPFGYGPRNCVGMRFALLEMKLILAKILLKYDVKATTNTCSSLSYTEGTVRRPKNKIIIKLEKRTRYN